MDELRFYALLHLFHLLGNEEALERQGHDAVIRYAHTKIKATAETCERPGCKEEKYIGVHLTVSQQVWKLSGKSPGALWGTMWALIQAHPLAAVAERSQDMQVKMPVLGRACVNALAL